MKWFFPVAALLTTTDRFTNAKRFRGGTGEWMRLSGKTLKNIPMPRVALGILSGCLQPSENPPDMRASGEFPLIEEKGPALSAGKPDPGRREVRYLLS